MYTAFVLDDETRDDLLARFPPKYEKVIAHHITVDGGAKKDSELTDFESLKIVGEADSKDGLQALVVTVDGNYNRPDGKPYHITWSLDPDKYKPVDSSELIADYSKRWKLCLGRYIVAEAMLLK